MDSNSSDRQMFDATCAECGQATQVPFQPTEGRPVYCRDCFSKVRGTRKNSTSSNSRYSDRPMYDVTCSSCGKPAQVPFQPTGDKPVYCRDCFKKNRA